MYEPPQNKVAYDCTGSAIWVNSDKSNSELNPATAVANPVAANPVAANPVASIISDMPVIYAVENCSLALIKILLVFPGINFNVKNEHGQSALEIAIQRVSVNTQDNCLHPPQRLPYQEWSQHNTDENKFEIVLHLLSIPEINTNEELDSKVSALGKRLPFYCQSSGSPLLIALQFGHSETVKKLLSVPGIDMQGTNERTLLQLTNFTCRNGQVSLGDILAKSQRHSEHLQDDKEVVMFVVGKVAQALKNASAALQGDKEVVFVAVKQDGEMLKYASDSLKNDKEIVTAAI